MTTIVTRVGKGSALTFQEGDANFVNLNTDKLENIVNESIGDLNDVDLTGIEDGQILIFDGAQNKFVAGEGLSGGTGPQVDDNKIALTDLSVTVAVPSDISDLSYADTTGVFTFTPVDTTTLLDSLVQDTAPQLGGNLDVNGFGIVNTTGSGDIVLNSDTLMLGLGQDPEGVVITTQGALDLVLDTNDGIDTGEIRIETGASGNIVLEPTGTGKIVLAGLEWPGDPDSESGSPGGGGIVQVASGTVTSISNNRVFLNNFAGIGIGPVYDQQIQFTGSQVTQLGLSEQQMYFIVDADATNDSIEISEISNFSPPVPLTDNSSVTDVAFAVFEIEATAGTNQPPTQYSGTVLAIDDARQPNTLTLSDSQQLPGQFQGATIVFTGTDTTAVGLQENFAYNIQGFIDGDKIEINEGAGALDDLNAGLGGPYDINYTITEGQAPSGPGGTGTITEGSVLTYVTGTLQWQLPPGGGAPPPADLSSLTDVNAPAPLNGDLLVYNNASNQWESQAPAGGGGFLTILQLVNAAPQTVSGNIQRWQFRNPINLNQNQVVLADLDYRFSLPAGTYVFEISMTRFSQPGSWSGTNNVLRNLSTGDDVVNNWLLFVPTGSTITNQVNYFYAVLTVTSSSHLFELRSTISSNLVNARAPISIKLFKA